MRVYTGWMSGDVAWKMQMCTNILVANLSLTNDPPSPESLKVQPFWVQLFPLIKPIYTS